MKNIASIILKPEWMRPPSWRWHVTLEHLADPSLNGHIKRDSLLEEAIKFKRYEKENLGTPQALYHRYPEMNEAFQIYLNTAHEGWKWLLEAYLMTDASNPEIATRLGVPIKPEVIKRYRHIFFDIDSYRKSLPAISANLLATSKARVDGTGVSDYTWKVFAYVWGAEAFEKLFLPGKQRKNRDHVMWLRENNSVGLDATSFSLTSNLRNTYNEEVISILDTAQKYWDIEDQAKSKLQDESASAFINTLSAHVNMKILRAPERKTDVAEDFTEEAASIYTEG